MANPCMNCGTEHAGTLVYCEPCFVAMRAEYDREHPEHIDDRPIELWTVPNWLVGKVVDEDEYRLGAYLESRNERSIWRTKDNDMDVTFNLAEMRELHELIGRVLSGEPGTPYEESDAKEKEASDG
jgi:hypothetical protein